MKTEYKIKTHSWRWYLLIVITGLVVSAMVVYSNHKAVRMSTVYAPLIDAAMEIKLEATTAHLWFEEILSGDYNEDIEVVWKHLEQADWYVRAMLEGGKNSEGIFYPLNDAGMRKKILNVRAKLSEFKNISVKRLTTIGTSAAGTDIDQNYDAVFNSFIAEADEVETRLQEIMAQDLRRFRFTQTSLISISSLLIFVVGIASYRIERRRIKDAIKINYLNENLGKLVTERTAELTIINEDLKCSVEENRLIASALQESEEKFRSISNLANDAVIMLDNDGNVKYWNDAAEKIFDYSMEEVIGVEIEKLIIPERIRETHINAFKRFRDTGQGAIIGKTVELIAINKAGTEFPIELSLSAVKLGGKWNAIGIGRNITERKQAEVKIKASLNGVISTLALTIEQRDPYTAGHQQRVSKLSCVIAEEMGLSKNQIEGIYMAGIVHDIGKMHVPVEILSRPGKLTECELNIVKSHAQVGYDILKGVEFPWPIADIVHQHHEKMDGSGYPQGLSNGDILIDARILCVADVVEAMASHRPYRPALGIEKALEEIARGKGICYDSGVVDVCVKVIKEKGFVFEQQKSSEV